MPRVSVSAHKVWLSALGVNLLAIHPCEARLADGLADSLVGGDLVLAIFFSDVLGAQFRLGLGMVRQRKGQYWGLCTERPCLQFGQLFGVPGGVDLWGVSSR